MKNYALDENVEKAFINYYEKDTKYLMIHYADERVDKIPNTIHNEKMILNRMKLQVENASNYYDIMKNSFITNSAVGASAILFVGLESYISTLGNYGISNNVAVIIGLIAGAMACYGIKESIDNVKDYSKNKLFLDYEDLINEYVSGDRININDIHFMEYKELQEIVLNVKKLKKCKQKIK